MLLQTINFNRILTAIQEAKQLRIDIASTENQISSLVNWASSNNVKITNPKKLIQDINQKVSSGTPLSSIHFLYTPSVSISILENPDSRNSQLRSLLSPLIGKEVTSSAVEKTKKARILFLSNSVKKYGVTKSNFDFLMKRIFDNTNEQLDYVIISPDGFIVNVPDAGETPIVVGGGGSVEDPEGEGEGEGGDSNTSDSDWEFFVIRGELQGYPGKVSESETLGSNIVIESQSVNSVNLSFGVKSKLYTAEQIINGDVNLSQRFTAVARNLKVRFSGSASSIENMVNGILEVPGEFDLSSSGIMSQIDNTVTEPSVIFVGNLYRYILNEQYDSTTIYGFIETNYPTYRTIKSIECQVSLNLISSNGGEESNFVKTFSLTNSVARIPTEA